MGVLKALCAVLAAALIGVLSFAAGSASATALCKVSTNPCPQASIHPSKTALEGKLKTTGIVLDANGGEDVECSEVTLKGEWETDGSGEFKAGKLSEFNLPAAKCKALPSKTACTTISTMNTPYNMGVSASGGGNGTISFTGAAIKFECGASVNCTFLIPGLPFETTGGKPATANLKATKLEWFGSACPSLSAEMQGEFEFTAPAELFVVSSVAPPLLCKKNEVPCTAPNILGVPTTLKAEYAATAKFKFTYLGENKEPSCTNSKFEGKTTTAGKPLVGEYSLSFENCGGGVCNITTTGGPYKFEIDRAGGGNGAMTWSKLTGTEPTFKIKCGLSPPECVYKATSINWTITGSLTAPTFATSGSVGLTGSSPGCSTTATWEGIGGIAEVKYKLTTPTELFVTS